MANEYSYNELMEMQDRAIKRVRDMQERARRTLEESQASVNSNASPPPTESASQGISASHRVSASQGAFPKPEYAVTAQKKPPFSLDGDKAAILPILLLLWREGADNMLLAALMYIMA